MHRKNKYCYSRDVGWTVNDCFSISCVRSGCFATVRTHVFAMPHSDRNGQKLIKHLDCLWQCQMFSFNQSINELTPYGIMFKTGFTHCNVFNKTEGPK